MQYSAELVVVAANQIAKIKMQKAEIKEDVRLSGLSQNQLILLS
jgi:hypothetical protein